MNLKTPLSKEIVNTLKIGDIVYLDGIIHTGRDEAHITVLEYAHNKINNNNNNNNKIKEIEEVINKLKNGVIYHAGPIMKKVNNKWQCVAIGPTTSARMNNLEEEFIKITNISAIVGKGGMDDNLLSIFSNNKTVYLSAPGGCAALLANCIKSVKTVYCEDLGMPESFWELEVENFGPLVVSMDSNGNSIYKEVNKTVKNNLKMLLCE